MKFMHQCVLSAIPINSRCYRHHESCAGCWNFLFKLFQAKIIIYFFQCFIINQMEFNIIVSDSSHVQPAEVKHGLIPDNVRHLIIIQVIQTESPEYVDQALPSLADASLTGKLNLRCIKSLAHVWSQITYPAMMLTSGPAVLLAFGGTLSVVRRQVHLFVPSTSPWPNLAFDNRRGFLEN